VSSNAIISPSILINRGKYDSQTSPLDVKCERLC